jgi:hypothetical protein
MEIRLHHTTPANLSLRLTPKEGISYAPNRNSLLRFFLPAFSNSSRPENILSSSVIRNLLVSILTITLMLLTFQNSLGQIALVTGSPQSNTSTGATLTILKPSGLAIGDMMIANIVQSDKGPGLTDLSNATSTGWTVIDGRQTGTGGSGNEWWGTVFYKIATAADVSAANFVFTFDSDADAGEGAIIAFSNVDVTGGVTETGSAGGPFDVDPLTINVTNTNSTTLTATSTSTASNYAAVILLGMLGNNFNLASWQIATGPTTLNELYDVPFNNSQLNLGMGAAWNIIATPAATGSGTATISTATVSGGLIVTLKAKCNVNFGTIASADQTFCAGSNDPSNVTFSITPSGGFGSFNYQWYYQDGIVGCPSGTSTFGWTAIGGANSNTYDPPSGLTGSRTYAVQVDPTGTPDCGPPTWATNCRKITILPVVDYGTITSGDETICNGGDPSNITLSVAPSGGAGTFTYQWYFQDGLIPCPSGTSTAGWTPIASANSNSYNPPSGLTGSRTYAVFVDVTGSPDCGPATWANGCRQVTVLSVLNFGTLTSGDETFCAGSNDPSNITFSTNPSGAQELSIINGITRMEYKLVHLEL